MYPGSDNAKLKEEAIFLRKRGLSYSEILKEVLVAKSTLSLWLREVGLSKRQHQRLTQKRLLASIKGGEIRRENRISATEEIYKEARRDIKSISKRELWLMGTMLYWAEGTKEKEWHPGSGIQFTNSDPFMIKFFLRWLLEVMEIPKEAISFEITIHENNKHRLPEVRQQWSSISKFPVEKFTHIYFKRHNPKTKRRNIGEGYFGVLKIRVSASSKNYRKIAGWIKGVIEYFG